MPTFIFAALIICGLAADRLAAEDKDALTRQKHQDKFESLARDIHSGKLQITVDEANSTRIRDAGLVRKEFLVPRTSPSTILQKTWHER